MIPTHLLVSAVASLCEISSTWLPPKIAAFELACIGTWPRVLRHSRSPASVGDDGGDGGIREGLADDLRRDEASRAGDDDLHGFHYLKPLMGLAPARGVLERG